MFFFLVCHMVNDPFSLEIRSGWFGLFAELFETPSCVKLSIFSFPALFYDGDSYRETDNVDQTYYPLSLYWVKRISCMINSEVDSKKYGGG
jgi:hypothetical protein